MTVVKKFRIKSFKIKQKEIIEFKNISLSFNNRKILDNISFSINQNEIVGLLGPNGVGKSTIFNLIIGLLKPQFGSIEINNEKINSYPIYTRSNNFKIGYVPQYGGYFHDLNVLENLKAISELKILDKFKRDIKIDYLIQKFEFEKILNIKAKFLSGGQKKRLVISLGLVSEPKIFLMDEPFAALDVMTIKKIQNIIVNLQSENNLAIVVCDHQARDLLKCVDRAIILSNTKIIANGTPTEILNNDLAKKVYFGESFSRN